MSDINYAPSSSGSTVKIAILFGAVVALLAANIYLFVQLENTNQEIAKTREALQTEIGNLREANSVSAQTSRRTVESLREELETARRQSAVLVGQAKTDNEAKVADLNKRLEAEQKRVAAATAAIRTEIGEVKKDASETKEKLGAVGTEVGAVKSEVATTKSELDKTIAELKTVRGDMGVQSGLIATNGKELSALRALGERNYFEFNIGKTKAPVKVGDVSIMLKRTDEKRNKFTIEVFADDKKTEKKDKNLNEPLQFYTAKARQPYEIVVNTIKKDNIAGYLATPKVTQAR